MFEKDGKTQTYSFSTPTAMVENMSTICNKQIGPGYNEHVFARFVSYENKMATAVV